MLQYILKWNLIKCSGSLNAPPLTKETHARDIKLGKSSSGGNDFNYPPAKALRLAVTSGEKGGKRVEKAASRSRPGFPGQREATRSSGEKLHLVIGRNASQLTLTSDNARG